MRPSGENLIQATVSVCPFNSTTHRPSFAFHRKQAFPLLVATLSPLGEKEHTFDRMSFPSISKIHSPDVALHTLMQSLFHVANRAPLGRKETPCASVLHLCTACPLSISQMQHSPSSDRVAMSAPSGENEHPSTLFKKSSRMSSLYLLSHSYMHSPVWTFQTRHDSSSEQVASTAPLGEKVHEKTLSKCWSKWWTHSPVRVSHTRHDRSSDADANKHPSGENEQWRTLSSCPSNTKAHW
mmetsp:Transcript_48375/g.125438  ORF Transcript_48375/g.125438 Transcript_48375/m.125438 type:complete len:239 (+) Transcript_48375:1364-2080(+)